MTRNLMARWVFRALAAYAVLWILTATIGRYQVRTPILAAVRDTVLKARPNLPSLELPTDSFVARPPAHKQYYVIASSPGPFLLQVRRGYMIEPLWGAGAEEWYLWLFGARFRVAQPKVWWS